MLAHDVCYRPSIERFWNKVQRGTSTECWPWQAGRFKEEYGAFWLDGRNQRAHRVAFALHHGRQPVGLVCHTCDNPPCCNPAHLFEGTTGDNTRDAMTKHRLARGVTNGRAKLTEEQVLAIRAERAAGATLLPLAAKYGVAHSLIERIVARQMWRHI